MQSSAIEARMLVLNPQKGGSQLVSGNETDTLKNDLNAKTLRIPGIWVRL